MTDVIRVFIRREDPLAGRGPCDQVYEIRADRDMTILEVLQEIYLFLDPTLAFRPYRCGRRLCRSCEVNLDGRTVRNCATLLHPGKTYRLEATRQESVIRDLVFDFDAPHPSATER
jgi:succinate dehydrogenase/fumarate reductase-like Fe-S protein